MSVNTPRVHAAAGVFALLRPSGLSGLVPSASRLLPTARWVPKYYLYVALLIEAIIGYLLITFNYLLQRFIFNPRMALRHGIW